MAQVRITGWRYGLEKVSMTTTLREALGLGLADAKRCTDRVVDGELVLLDVADREAAVSLVQALHALGANAEIATDAPPGEAVDVVHTLDDYYDGPRSGAAELGGAPYWYRSVYLDGEAWNPDEDRFEMTPLTPEALAWAVESSAIFDRWDAARTAGEVTWEPTDDEDGDAADTFGALPDELPRRRELDRLLEDYLATHPPTVMVRGAFVSGARLVRWTPIDVRCDG